MDKGIVIYATERITPAAKFYNLLDCPRHLNKEVSSGPGREYLGHVALKKLAADYLSKKGMNYKFEKPLIGLVPDVVSEDEKVVVECGNTSPNKIVDYLSSGLNKVGVIPFPFEGDSSLKIYWFSKGNGFTDYLDERKNFLKEIHRKFHRGNR